MQHLLSTARFCTLLQPMVFTGAPNDLRSGGVGSTGVGDSRDCEENLGSEEDSVLQIEAAAGGSWHKYEGGAGGRGVPVLDLGKVTANGNHVLRAIVLCNRSAGALDIELSSDRTNVHFQLDNQNLPEDALAEGVDADFNELFNTIGYVDRVTLSGGERRRLIVLFLPADLDDAQSCEQRHSDGHRDGRAGAVIPSTPVLGRTTQLSEGGGGGGGGAGSMSSKVSGSIFFKCVSADGGRGGAGVGGVLLALQTLKLQATVCRCILQVQPTEIMLPACIPGHKYYRDFSIINASDITLQYSVVMSPTMQNAVANGSLILSEVDQEEDAVTQTFTVLDGSIQPSRSVRARVTFIPQEVGDFSFDARFDNLNNESNSDSLRLVAVVSSNESSQDLLQVKTRDIGPVLDSEQAVWMAMRDNAVLDFGSCCTGIGRHKVCVCVCVCEIERVSECVCACACSRLWM